jgi:hypothetical protein
VEGQAREVKTAVAEARTVEVVVKLASEKQEQMGMQAVSLTCQRTRIYAHCVRNTEHKAV